MYVINRYTVHQLKLNRRVARFCPVDNLNDVATLIPPKYTAGEF